MAKKKSKTIGKKASASKKKTTKKIKATPAPKIKKKTKATTKKSMTKASKPALKKLTKKSPQHKINAPDIITQVNEIQSSNSLARLDPITQYLAEIRKYPLITKEEERELAVKYYETGDPAAAEKLVTSNLRFVVKIAAEYSKFGSKMIDLVQEGNVGLMHAVREFNPYKDVRLITYAVWWIRGYIRDFLMKQYSLVKIGTTQNQRKLFYQLQRQKKELENMGLDSSIKQLSGRLGIPEQEIIDMSQRMSGHDVSLDQPIKGSETNTLIDLQEDQYSVSVDDELELKELVGRLNEKIDKVRPNLNDREVFLLESRLLSDEPLTLQEVGDKYGITREAVRQLEVRLIKKIKHDFMED